MRMAWAVFTHCCDSGRPFRHHPQRRCLHPLLQSVYHVAYLRGLFPEKTFKGMRTCSGVWQGCAATYWIPVCEELPAWPPPAQMGACPHLPAGVDMQNLDGLHIKMLDRRQENEEAQRLIDWVEGGGCRKQCGAGARGLAHLRAGPPASVKASIQPANCCATTHQHCVRHPQAWWTPSARCTSRSSSSGSRRTRTPSACWRRWVGGWVAGVEVWHSSAAGGMTRWAAAAMRSSQCSPANAHPHCPPNPSRTVRLFLQLR